MIPVLAAEAGTAAGIVTGDFLPWVVLFLPLTAAFLIALVPGLRRGARLAPALAIASVGIGFGIAFFAYFVPALFEGMVTREGLVTWIDSGSVLIPFGTRMDALALTMTLVVTGVGFAIFVYALGYMHGDDSIGRFYAKFSLFVFSMLGIVLSPNFFQTFVFWELVGASSYLLIGYYWKKHSAGEAAKKAFMTNRVGDFAFFLGILMVWAAVGNATGVVELESLGAFDFTVIQRALGQIGATVLFGSVGLATLAAALVFGGAMGKSAQFPLHVWLPDAMEGPTPVSALMHAATMVAAGVYMIIRCFFLYEDTTWAPSLLAWLGAITALMAATMAITQRDIKKVLAYSTLSQLGYMTMALGVGAYTAAMFHLTTHAFFKALLFLCAGSVIHGCHHEQDMFKMGGLARRMPATYRTFVIGTLALCGIFPLAGFWSKDEILSAVKFADGTHGPYAIPGHTFLFVVGLITAGLTAFYMGRAWVLTFRGEYRGHAHPHESPKVMTVPLWALAVFSVFVGFVGVPGQTTNRFEHFLHAWHLGEAATFHVDVALVSTVVALGGLLLAFRVYGRAAPGTDPLPARLGPVWTLWNRLYYVDDVYLFLVKKVQQGFAGLLWLFERWVIIGLLANGTAYVVKVFGDQVRRVQTGRLSSYVAAFVLGVAVVAAIAVVAVAVAGAAAAGGRAP
jgi:NADH-quinone oxidoreductase subunit L